MNAPVAIPAYRHTPLFPAGTDATPYRKLTCGGRAGREGHGQGCRRGRARGAARARGGGVHRHQPSAAPGHLKQLRTILDDPEATDNDKFVAYDFLKNANIAAGGVLPMCQDTGTAIIMGKKGRLVWTEGDDEARARRGRPRRLPQAQPALLPARAALDVRGEEHRQQHAGAGRDLRRGRGRLQVPVHRQGRRLRQQVVPVPGDARRSSPTTGCWRS